MPDEGDVRTGQAASISPTPASFVKQSSESQTSFGPHVSSEPQRFEFQVTSELTLELQNKTDSTSAYVLPNSRRSNLALRTCWIIGNIVHWQLA